MIPQRTFCFLKLNVELVNINEVSIEVDQRIVTVDNDNI